MADASWLLALSRGCCSRATAAEKGCALCVPRYEAIDRPSGATMADPVIAALQGIELMAHPAMAPGAIVRVPDSGYLTAGYRPGPRCERWRLVMHPSTLAIMREEVRSLCSYADAIEEIRYRRDERNRWADDGGACG